MAIILATKTLAAIEAQIESDQGAAFRANTGKVLPHMDDAYRGVDPDGGFRSHLGASGIGDNCARKIWYQFHWALKPNFSGRMLRLFNRGHLEEARFIAMLLSIGVQVYQQDAQGKQFRISDVGGHFGGSGDGVGIGIPDLAAGTSFLLEFKTHNDKSFIKLQKEGVQLAKPVHYVQMQTYMRKMNLTVALYGAVNKNNDEIHLELIYLDTLCADQFLDRAKQIIMMRTAPKKLNESIGYYECKWCDLKYICHLDEKPAVNCRTCYYSHTEEDGTWRCGNAGAQNMVIPKELQLTGCAAYLKF
jgi:hypothetical protein